MANYVAVDAALIQAIGALDTTIAVDTLGAATAALNKWTERGIKNGGFLTRAQVTAGACMILNIEGVASGITVGSEITLLLGVEIDYAPILATETSVAAGRSRSVV